MAWDISGSIGNAWYIGSGYGSIQSGNTIRFQSYDGVTNTGMVGSTVMYTQNPPLDPGTSWAGGSVPGMGLNVPNSTTIYELSYDAWLEAEEEPIGDFVIRFTIFNQSGFEIIFEDTFINTLDYAAYYHHPIAGTNTITIQPSAETNTYGRRVLTSNFTGSTTGNITHWGKMFVEIKDIFGQVISNDSCKWEGDNFSLREITGTSTSVVGGVLPDWDRWDNWDVVNNKFVHIPGTSGVYNGVMTDMATLSQEIQPISGQTPGGLEEGQEYEITMDLMYTHGTGTANNSRVHLPNVGPGNSHVFLTAYGGTATATWVQSQDQSDLVIVQRASGGAEIDNIELRRLTPYGGTVVNWNLVGDPDEIYWSPNTSGGNASGYVHFDNGDEDVWVEQDISHLNLQSGTEVKVSFKVFDYVEGELACHVYNTYGEGVSFNGANSNGIFEFTGTIGDSQLPNVLSGHWDPDLENKFAITYSTDSNFTDPTTLSVDNLSLSLTSDIKTITFNEKVRGWVSFKTFSAEQARSMGNNYYTMLDGFIHKHHDSTVDRNTFYGYYNPSSVDVVLNSASEVVKSFNTLDYEGTQSKIEPLVTYGTTGLIGVETGVNLIYMDQSNPPEIMYSISSFVGSNIATVGQVDLSNVTVNNLGIGQSQNPPVGGIDRFTFHGADLSNTLTFYLTAGKMYRLKFDYNINQDSVTLAASELAYFSPFPVNPAFIFEELTGSGSVEQDYTAIGTGSIMNIHLFHPFFQTQTLNNINFTISNLEFYELDFITQHPENQFYNLESKDGWYVDDITTDMQEGSINEFIEKEGKWFNFIKGKELFGDGSAGYKDFSSVKDFGEFGIQGLGVPSAITTEHIPTRKILTFTSGMAHNTSLQIGDDIYYSIQGNISQFTTVNPSDITKYGHVIDVDDNTITISPLDVSLSPVFAPTAGVDYFMFVKNQVANKSGLVGYYADIKLKNNSKDYAELFSIGSEITPSSK